jgi:hypothetical protein
VSAPVLPLPRPAGPPGRRPARALLGAAEAAALALGFIALGLLVAAAPLIAIALVLLVLAVTGAVARPVVLGLLAVAVLGLVPVYAAPKFGPLEADPAVLLSWMAAGGALLGFAVGRQRGQVTALDGCMAAYVGLLFLPVLFGARERGDYLSLIFATVGPYLGMRLIVPQLGASWLPRAFALSALLALPTVLYEALSGTNPFDAFQFNAAEAAAWGEAQYRFGVLRAEGAFGQAISLSQFAGTVMVLALGSAVLARDKLTRRLWGGVLLAAGAMLALSYSRTGWIIFGLGVVLVAVFVLQGRARLRLLYALAAALVLGGLALEVAGLMDSVLRLVNDDTLSNSNNYREVLLQRALRGEGLAWFGLKQTALGAGIDAGGASIDNAYLDIASSWGYVGLIGFVGVALGVAGALWRLRGTAWALVPAITLANFAGLFQVAINTQTQFWLWMLVGGTAAACAVPAATASRSPAPRT